MDVLVNESLKPYNTFSVDARADRLVHAESLEDVLAAIRLSHKLEMPFLLLGGGSNMLFTDDYPGIVIHLANRGVEIDTARAHLHVSAGENWHDLVVTCLEQGLYGLENLALIPGSVGAAPVQNIGAYGVELSSFLDYVDVLDIETEVLTRMTAEQCRFGYRDSIFKNELKAQSIIMAVGLQLSTEPAPVVEYPSLQKYLEQTGTEPTPKAVFDAVCAIRRARLPDPAVIGNAGSFFKNPIISAEQFKSLKERFEDLPSFAVKGDEQRVKVPAAWLIEKAGWKGKRNGDAGVHSEQALVLVNHGNASGEEIVQLARAIATSVRQHFDIRLAPEVRLVPDRHNG